MSKFDEYKKIIFSTPQLQQELVTAIKSQGYKVDDFDAACASLFYKASEEHYQKIMAFFLRKLAISHLSTGNTILATAFRDDYNLCMSELDEHEHGDSSTLVAFFETQSKPYAFATDIEASALSELFNITFACTQVNEKAQANGTAPVVYYKAPADNANIVHLYNLRGCHFFVREGEFDSTIGDGNCLYNGFAQVMRQYALFEETNDISIFQHQEQLYAQIKKIPPLSLADLMSRVRAQVNDVSPEIIAVASEELVKSVGVSGGNVDELDQSANITGNPDDVSPEIIAVASEELVKSVGASSENVDELDHSANIITGNIDNEETLLKSNVTSDFFFKVMSYPSTQFVSNVLMIAGLLAIGIGIACLCPASVPLMSSIGVTLSQPVAINLALAGLFASVAGMSARFFAKKTGENLEEEDVTPLVNTGYESKTI